MVTNYPDYPDNRKFADKHHYEIKQILEDNLMHITRIEIAPDELDMKYSTDYEIKIEGGNVSARVRRPDCKKYRDFTVRAYNKGFKTEIHKLKEGFGDWYLYCWTNDNNEIDEWILLDLNKVRQNELLNHRKEIDNYDGTKFIHIDITELNIYDCLINSKLKVERGLI